jgi:hypothetical protein
VDDAEAVSIRSMRPYSAWPRVSSARFLVPGVLPGAGPGFESVFEAAPAEPGEILYVGDRLGNDIRPAVRAELLTALIRRGPWSTIPHRDPDADAITTMRIDSLAELPEKIAAFLARADGLGVSATDTAESVSAGLPSWVGSPP